MENLLKNIFIVLILSTLFACGPKPPKVPTHPHNASFNSIVDNFERHYQNATGINIDVGVPVFFDDSLNDMPSVVGVCREWSNGYKEIGVLKSFWDYASDTSKQTLIFHELGHCFVNVNLKGLFEEIGFFALETYSTNEIYKLLIVHCTKSITFFGDSVTVAAVGACDIIVSS